MSTPQLVDLGVVAELETAAGSAPSPPAPGAPAGVTLARDEMVAVFAPDHPLATEPTVTLADLTEAGKYADRPPTRR